MTTTTETTETTENDNQLGQIEASQIEASQIEASQIEVSQIEVSPFDRDVHHMTPYPTDPAHLAKVLEFRSILQNSGNDLYIRNMKWCTDLQLVRFLIARKWVIKDAHDLIMTAFEWRSSRKPDEVEQTDGWAERMSNESNTGKIYLPGKDHFGRPIIVLDNSVQNTNNPDNQMMLLAWSMEVAIREMPIECDKYLIFVHLEKFSLFNNPSMACTRETLKMLCDCFPERLGHLIAYQPPWIFKAVYEALKSFIDPKTSSKFIFIYGDDSDGSDNDILMKSVIGPNWKALTGAAQPVLSTNTSPGYSHATHWPKLMDRVLSIQKKESAVEGQAFASPLLLPLPPTEGKTPIKSSKSD